MVSMSSCSAADSICCSISSSLLLLLKVFKTEDCCCGTLFNSPIISSVAESNDVISSDDKLPFSIRLSNPCKMVLIAHVFSTAEYIAVRLLLSLDRVDGGTKDEVSVIVHDDSNINDGSSKGESDVLGSFMFLRCFVELLELILFSVALWLIVLADGSYLVREAG